MQSGCAACLVLPPFFFKDVSDDGLFAWYARVIEAVGDARLRILLYHIPQVTGVPLSVDLVARLAAAFPGIIAGVKDSSGEWANTSALLERVPQLAILVGHEPHLPRALSAGGAGTICGVANTYPAIVRALFSPSVSQADEERIATFIDIAFRQPFLPAFKAIVAAQTGEPGWHALCPPWIPLDEGQRRTLLAALADAGMPVLPAPATISEPRGPSRCTIQQQPPRTSTRSLRSTLRRSATRSSVCNPTSRAMAIRRERSSAVSHSRSRSSATRARP